jgi:hypothetical protein
VLENVTFDRLKELLIVIPAAHIFLCFCYLFFYYSSFGHGIWTFSSPTDVFSVSFSDVAPGYIFLALGMAAGYYAFAPRPNADRSGGSAPRYLAVMFWVFVAGSAFMVLVALAVWMRSGFLFFELLTGPMALLTGYAWGRWGRRFTGAALAHYLTLGIPLAIVSMAFRGLSDGQLDRAVIASDLSASSPRCGDKQVLRALASDFLAVGPDNSRLVIDRDCRTKFTLIRAEKFVARPHKAPIDIALGN